MDPGSREGQQPVSMPFPAHYPSITDATLQIVLGSNGVPPNTSEVKAKEVVRYGECRKNHAATIGGHALDGCGEFMPTGEGRNMEGLRCAACGCHRNFHRREVEGEHTCDCHHMCGQKERPAFLEPPTPLALSLPAPKDTVSSHTQMLMALSSTPANSDEPDAPHGLLGSSMKKRFRTKFTAEQKEKMHAFAEKLGWRIQKHDDVAVQEFCTSVEVKCSVLKVWMHSNKNIMGNNMEKGPEVTENDCTSASPET